MKHLIVGVLLFCSCGSKLSESDIGKHKLEGASSDKVSLDTLGEVKRIHPDYFEISNEDFIRYESKEINWFISKDGLSRLYLVPYTDYSITTAILTSNLPVDSNLISLLELERIEFRDTTKAIKVKSLESKKGIKLGLTFDEVKSEFGIPDTEVQLGEEKKATWSFDMKEDDLEDRFGGLRPFIMRGLGFTSEMTFDSEDKLIELVYQYEVP
jgi:hypothetical protein